ncbi:hypothetical protein ATI61_104506 [Archangium gephyra]|uniref:Ferritin-like domain-containing protein n=1 Tax=Archangium gephyra TaxID=48 RepID=A0AAC8Q356_9BACT|nr:ferritin-like domain-containing protein [Archangium gephyra]AKJ00086.1 Hypothetical protein AA314_01712 [Archangium gephyra]REG33215.1 hypothetical protein ATI61_104506 [Archangium gephyra]
MRTLKHTGGLFQRLHQKTVGTPPELTSLRPEAVPPELLPRVRRTWQERAQSEFRSIQILTRFLTEVVGSGDPLEVYAGAVEAVEDEVRHTALCAAVCEALGAPVLLPEPLPLLDPEGFLKAPMPERALATALTMLCINETLSVGYIEDLRARCTQPGLRAVLDTTLADEGEHGDYGWAYADVSLQRFPASTRKDWRHLVAQTLAPHQEQARRALADVPQALRVLEAHPEPELSHWGILGPVRQALVFERTFQERVAPRLRKLELLG